MCNTFPKTLTKRTTPELCSDPPKKQQIILVIPGASDKNLAGFTGHFAGVILHRTGLPANGLATNAEKRR